MRGLAFILALFYILVVLLAVNARAADVTLQWDAVDDPSLVGYKLYYNEWSQLTGNVTEYTLINLTPGETYNIYATAYSDIMESGPSNTVIHKIPEFEITDNPKPALVIIIPITINVN